MLNGIDFVYSPIKYTYIAARLTGALIKCKSNDKESVGDYSRPRADHFNYAATPTKTVVCIAALLKWSARPGDNSSRPSINSLRKGLQKSVRMAAKTASRVWLEPGCRGFSCALDVQ